jgi:hypothetical protein
MSFNRIRNNLLAGSGIYNGLLKIQRTNLYSANCQQKYRRKNGFSKLSAKIFCIQQFVSKNIFRRIHSANCKNKISPKKIIQQIVSKKIAIYKLSSNQIPACANLIAILHDVDAIPQRMGSRHCYW